MIDHGGFTFGHGEGRGIRAYSSSLKDERIESTNHRNITRLGMRDGLNLGLRDCLVGKESPLMDFAVAQRAGKTKLDYIHSLMGDSWYPTGRAAKFPLFDCYRGHVATILRIVYVDDAHFPPMNLSDEIIFSS